MKLVNQVVRNFEVARVFREHTSKINSMDFSSSGDILISCSEDDQIITYDCEKGSVITKKDSQKYGVEIIRFTHDNSNVIFTSAKVNDEIRYFSVEDYRFIFYFSGHTEKVMSLCLSPIENTFLSASLDKTVRLWDFRWGNHQGLVRISGKPVAAYDPEGQIFAVGVDSQDIKLFDVRFFDKGPFVTFRYNQETECDWTGLKFSEDGKTILVSTNGSIIRSYDALLGTPLQSFSGYRNQNGVPIEASFSPDGQFIFNGSTNGRVHIWNASTGDEVCVLNGKHPDPVQCVQFNPKYAMLASACANVAFWLPAVVDT